MGWYHIRFTGKRLSDHSSGGLSEIVAMVQAGNIYEAIHRVKARYLHVTGLCATSVEGSGLDFFEISETPKGDQK